MISVSFLEGPLVDDDDGGDGGADDVVVVDLLASMMVLLEAAEFEQRSPANCLRSLKPQQQQLWRPPQNLAPMMEEAVDDDVILEEGVMILAEAVDSTLMVGLLVERMETEEVVEDLLQFRYLRQ